MQGSKEVRASKAPLVRQVSPETVARLDQLEQQGNKALLEQVDPLARQALLVLLALSAAQEPQD